MPTSDEPSLANFPFDKSHHAHTLLQTLKRAVALGPRYYCWDLPRYFGDRRRLDLSPFDPGVFINPVREVRRRVYCHFELPPSLLESLRLLGAAGVRMTIPPKRLEGLVGAWWATRDVPGDVIECGSFRGATALLLSLLEKREGRQGSVLMLDTFDGIPETSRHDNTRSVGEFATPANQVEVILRQASRLGIDDRIQIHRGLFAETFDLLGQRDSKFSFVHIDANVYNGTKQACEFTIPRTLPGGIVVFDDYNGMCDLGARLAIDQHFAAERVRLKPLAESSAYYRKPPAPGV